MTTGQDALFSILLFIMLLLILRRPLSRACGQQDIENIEDKSDASRPSS